MENILGRPWTRLFEGAPRGMALLAAVLVAALAAGLASACGGEEPEPEPPRPSYSLTHSAADADFVLGWDAIAAACPDVGPLQKDEAFARRGEAVPIGTDGTLETKADGAQAWKVQRFAVSEGAGGSRRIQMTVSFFDKRGAAEEQLRLMAQRTGAAAMLVGASGGMQVSVEEGDGFVFARMDSTTPTRSEQRFIASDYLLVHVIQTVRAGPAQLCTAEQLDELASEAGRNMAHATVTPLP